MKVQRITTTGGDYLVIDNQPLGAGLFLVALGVVTALASAYFWGREDALAYGMAFTAGVAVLMLVLLIRRMQAVFDRHAGTIEIRRQMLIGPRRVTRLRLDLFERAEVERSESDGTPTYRVVLIVAGDRQPLTIVYDNVNDHAAVARAINDWHRAPLDSHVAPA